MQETLRRLGITMGLSGTGIMEQMIYKRIRSQDLTKKEINDVLAAWDTRYYVPVDRLDSVDKVEPVITKEEVQQGIYTQEEYDRNYVEMIEKYLHTII